MLSKHIEDDSLFAGISHLECFQEYYKDYSIITTEQFIENVYNPWKQGQETMKKITPSQAQEIIDIVSPNCGWKARLVTLWANKIVLKEEIEVSEELLQQGRREASQSQKEVIDKIFGKEKEQIRVAVNSGVYGLVIDKSPVISSFTNNTIKLNDNFNWTLKDNILTVSHRD